MVHAKNAKLLFATICKSRFSCKECTLLWSVYSLFMLDALMCQASKYSYTVIFSSKTFIHDIRKMYLGRDWRVSWSRWEKWIVITNKIATFFITVKKINYYLYCRHSYNVCSMLHFIILSNILCYFCSIFCYKSYTVPVFLFKL